MLVVLPFENLGPELEQEYLNDGLTEETITQLGELNPRRLGVIARTSAMRYKKTREGIKQIGKELHVDYILEGGVRQQAQRARITAQLIRVSDQTHLWAASYDRNIGDLLTVQGEIAQAITQAIEIKLTPEERARLAAMTSVSHIADDDYLKGRYFWNERTAEALSKAIGYFEHAVQEDPNNTLAYAGLADCYAVLPNYSDTPASEAQAKAEAAAGKALQIDPTSGEAYATLAALSSSRWDWAEAGKKFQRAIELSPNYATAHQWYAEYLQQIGRIDEAAVELQRAEQLDPLSVVISGMLAQQFYFQRQYKDAIAQFQKVLAMDPAFPGIHLHIGLIYLATENSHEAIKEFVKERTTSPDDPMLIALLGYAHAMGGQPDEGRKAIRELARLGKRHAVPAFDYAVVEISLGDKDEAFRLLNKSVDEHYWLMALIKSSPFFDTLRGDTRFKILVARVFPPKF
jgi:TolB-like protein/Tfp pilus assembly protein PilF